MQRNGRKVNDSSSGSEDIFTSRSKPVKVVLSLKRKIHIEEFRKLRNFCGVIGSEEWVAQLILHFQKRDPAVKEYHIRTWIKNHKWITTPLGNSGCSWRPNSSYTNSGYLAFPQVSNPQPGSSAEPTTEPDANFSNSFPRILSSYSKSEFATGIARDCHLPSAVRIKTEMDNANAKVKARKHKRQFPYPDLQFGLHQKDAVLKVIQNCKTMCDTMSSVFEHMNVFLQSTPTTTNSRIIEVDISGDDDQ